jgi:hypothetical protein
MKERNDLHSLFTQESKNLHTKGKSTNSHYEKWHNISNPSFWKRMSQKKEGIVSQQNVIARKYIFKSKGPPWAFTHFPPYGGQTPLSFDSRLTADVLSQFLELGAQPVKDSLFGTR